ncbi:hypothetical protein FACS1894181_18980 [Bacteroidia bacterium]|nr:hypothetical protein FACS1894181_18980 [Bacteroidia bacterium]
MSQATISTILLDTNTTITHFDCGDTDLNDFLANDAANYQKEQEQTRQMYFDMKQLLP